MSSSLWLAAASPSAWPSLAQDLDVDVAVVGGGISGIVTALLCKRDGARVAVLERGQIAGGATGFTTAKASALQQTKLAEIERLHGAEATAIYARASLEAIELLDRFVHEYEIDCGWERLPDWTYALDDTQVEAIGEQARAARAAGLDVVEHAATPLPFPVSAAVRLRHQAQFNPVRLVRTLAQVVVGDDCQVFERTPVLDAEEGSPCTVTTEQGHRVSAGAVVVCTNYPLLDRGLFFTRTEATRSYLIAARVYDPVEQAMAISAGAPVRSFRSYTDPDGQPWVLVGGEGHTTGSEDAQPERYELLERFAREHFDVARVDYRWSTQDGMPVDRLPYAGRYTARSRHLFVNGGHQKWGMTNGVAGARIVADLIAGRENAAAATFDPHRHSLRAVPERAKAQAWVGAHMLGDRLAPAQASSADDVPAAEARVVRDGFGKVGVYRDEHERLHAVSLRCTHLGCLVHWNAAERSWDCPCHGSRFDIDGQVLAGPATAPLQRREPPT
ncbi:MAG TPA: FAD-dependent oxidoreductase [Conexibacter sp.]|nr:FAD-dependent oxidoreductase [Conexibacter sp.]